MPTQAVPTASLGLGHSGCGRWGQCGWLQLADHGPGSCSGPLRIQVAKRILSHSFHTPHFSQKSWLETGRLPFQLEEQVEEKLAPRVGACQPSKQPACWFLGASVSIRVSLHPTRDSARTCSAGVVGLSFPFLQGFPRRRRSPCRWQGRFHSQPRMEHSRFYQEWRVKMQLLSQEAHWGSQNVKHVGFHIRRFWKGPQSCSETWREIEAEEAFLLTH